MAPEKDYTHRSWIAVTLLIAVLIGLSLIPPQTLGGVSLRRANILSDLISFEEDLEKAEKAIDLDDADFHIDLTQVARQIADTVNTPRPPTNGTSGKRRTIRLPNPGFRIRSGCRRR